MHQQRALPLERTTHRVRIPTDVWYGERQALTHQSTYPAVNQNTFRADWQGTRFTVNLSILHRGAILWAKLMRLPWAGPVRPPSPTTMIWTLDFEIAPKKPKNILKNEIQKPKFKIQILSRWAVSQIVCLSKCCFKPPATRNINFEIAFLIFDFVFAVQLLCLRLVRRRGLHNGFPKKSSIPLWKHKKNIPRPSPSMMGGDEHTKWREPCLIPSNDVHTHTNHCVS